VRTAWLVCLMLAAGGARAGTLDVPAQYATIQAALDAAAAGDTIVVQPGAYHEALVFPGFGLTLVAPGGSSVTTVDASGLGTSVMTIATTTGDSVIVDGFTITGGEGTLIQSERWGGGLLLTGPGTVTLRNAVVTGNTALVGSGGGISVGSGNGFSAKFVAEDCEIHGNSATSGGGIGAWFFMTQTPSLTRCVISDNHAVGGQGGGLKSSHQGSMEDCLISGNTALSSGGGGMHGDFQNWVFTRTTFQGNSAAYGGALSLSSTSPGVGNVTFIGNAASVAGGAVSLSSNCDCPLFCFSPSLSNCTFIGNTSAGAPISVSSYQCSSTQASVRYCNFFGEAAANGNFTGCILRDVPSPPVNADLTYCNIEGGWPGEGNIDADPLFANAALGDYHLLAASPCRNAGPPNASLAPPTDFEGDPRVLEGRVDMGIDEFADDCNGNGVLDWQDLQAGTSSDCADDGIPDECQPLVDCNGNGNSDACDIAMGRSTDCNHNGLPDECESLADCDGDGIPDACEDADCNGNGVPDACDLAAGTSVDTNGDGILDECQQFLYVPSDHPTIAAAVQAAAAGDTIFLEPGVHAGPGNHDVSLTKKLLIAGTSGAEECIIDCEQAGRAFRVEGALAIVELRGLTIRNGSAVGGGGVDCAQDAQLRVNACVLRDNTSGSQPGGGLYVHGGASATLESSTLSDNTAPFGGAVSVGGASLVATHCTFTDNTASGALLSSKGGTLRAHAGATLAVRDSILVGGSADLGHEIQGQDAGTTIDVAWSDVAGGQPGVSLQSGATLAWGPGNIDADPLLKNPAGGDWRLSGGSPCIDSGDPAGSADADGTPPDMGAFPFEAFADLGFALAGAAGAPQLAGTGTLIAGDPVTVTLSGALPASGATLVLGATLLFAPFKGGLMVPEVDLLLGPLPTDPAGILVLAGTWPSGVPSGFVFFVQAWLVDAGGPAGFSASNGLSVEAR